MIKNEFNLNIPRYIYTFEPEPLVDMNVIKLEISELQAELAIVEERMTIYLRELGL